LFPVEVRAGLSDLGRSAEDLARVSQEPPRLLVGAPVRWVLEDLDWSTLAGPIQDLLDSRCPEPFLDVVEHLAAEDVGELPFASGDARIRRERRRAHHAHVWIIDDLDRRG
jgi:hypothetical protein